MNKHKIVSLLLIVFLIVGFGNTLYAQSSRVGTVTANFLEMGFGSAGSAMGDAAVALSTDLGAMYWNPAGLGYMTQSEAQFSYHPWVADITTSFSGVGLVLPMVGTIGLGIWQVGYGDMDVTNLEFQEGTGETFSANDLAASLTYSRRLAQWFSFGASFKYVNSKIWHSSASAMALDLGVLLNTNFFSPTGKRADGMSIGMSIANYGTRMQFDGIDLLQSIDILPNEEGNYKDTPGQFRLQEWELPLIFRVGIAVHPIVLGNHRLTIAADALHPNNNTESVNIGGQYELNMPAFGSFFLRGGMKALFMEDSEYGPTFGGGVLMKMMGNLGLRMDYSYKDIGILGNVHCYTVGVLF